MTYPHTCTRFHSIHTFNPFSPAPLILALCTPYPAPLDPFQVKLTIQAEVFNGAILQQTFVVEYVIENNMCLECTRLNANANTWTACVQVGGEGGREDMRAGRG